jgi:hypothetical protein
MKKRRELMLIVAMAAGLSTNAMLAHSPAEAKGKSERSSPSGEAKGKESASERSTPRGYERSGNPKAAGGPENPGKGNPHNSPAY